ncbi:Uncharacterised protein [Mycobacteroides abscessus subsp. abscessus]|nr:Uncharacterised protein [Mycobacteroides abscessus subsp. abscessus]
MLARPKCRCSATTVKYRTRRRSRSSGAVSAIPTWYAYEKWKCEK